MRRDVMGIHGGPARTPNFDALARDHLLFTHAYTQASWTKPSIATLFTGFYPSQHGLLMHPVLGRDDPDALMTDGLSEDYVTLAEVLASDGYETAAVISNPWLGRRFGW